TATRACSRHLSPLQHSPHRVPGFGAPIRRGISGGIAATPCLGPDGSPHGRTWHRGREKDFPNASAKMATGSPRPPPSMCPAVPQPPPPRHRASCRVEPCLEQNGALNAPALALGNSVGRPDAVPKCPRQDPYFYRGATAPEGVALYGPDQRK